jgi:hypothetical protein
LRGGVPVGCYVVQPSGKEGNFTCIARQVVSSMTYIGDTSAHIFYQANFFTWVILGTEALLIKYLQDLNEETFVASLSSYNISYLWSSLGLCLDISVLAYATLIFCRATFCYNPYCLVPMHIIFTLDVKVI